MMYLIVVLMMYLIHYAYHSISHIELQRHE